MLVDSLDGSSGHLSCTGSLVGVNFFVNQSPTIQSLQFITEYMFYYHNSTKSTGGTALGQRRKKRTRPPPKDNLLESFSSLKGKRSRPVVDTRTPQKIQENHIYHRDLPLWPPFFPAKKRSSLEQGGVCIFFPDRNSRKLTTAPIGNIFTDAFG